MAESKCRHERANFVAQKVREHMQEEMRVNKRFMRGNPPLNSEQMKFAAAAGAMCFDPQKDHAEFAAYANRHHLDMEKGLGIEQGLILHAVKEINAGNGGIVPNRERLWLSNDPVLMRASGARVADASTLARTIGALRSVSEVVSTAKRFGVK